MNFKLPKSCNGTTLVELLVAVGLLGVLSLAVMSLMENVYKNKKKVDFSTQKTELFAVTQSIVNQVEKCNLMLGASKVKGGSSLVGSKLVTSLDLQLLGSANSNGQTTSIIFDASKQIKRGEINSIKLLRGAALAGFTNNANFDITSVTGINNTNNKIISAYYEITLNTSSNVNSNILNAGNNKFRLDLPLILDANDNILSCYNQKDLTQASYEAAKNLANYPLNSLSLNGMKPNQESFFEIRAASGTKNTIATTIKKLGINNPNPQEVLDTPSMGVFNPNTNQYEKVCRADGVDCLSNPNFRKGLLAVRCMSEQELNANGGAGINSSWSAFQSRFSIFPSISKLENGIGYALINPFTGSKVDLPAMKFVVDGISKLVSDIGIGGVIGKTLGSLIANILPGSLSGDSSRYPNEIKYPPSGFYQIKRPGEMFDITNIYLGCYTYKPVLPNCGGGCKGKGKFKVCWPDYKWCTIRKCNGPWTSAPCNIYVGEGIPVDQLLNANPDPIRRQGVAP